MSPTPRAALLLGAAALSGLLLPLWVAVALVALVAAATLADAYRVRGGIEILRAVPPVLARATPGRFMLRPAQTVAGSVRLRQPHPPSLAIVPAEGDNALKGEIVAARRGRHVLDAAAVRRQGPLGLGCWYGRAGDRAEIRVFPDLPAARRLAHAVRRGWRRDVGTTGRGPLGLGTDFESIRDYVPDDDIRQVNWRATARTGRPMSNQYRVEQDRDVICVVDVGRLMGAPLPDRNRLDAALDAATAVAVMADELGDRSGAIAFDDAVRRRVTPRRRGSTALIEALFDLEASPADSDYELAFRAVAGGKRSFVLVLTDLLEEAAARPLAEAVPILARRHVVAVAGVSDPDVEAAIATPPRAIVDVYAAAAALELAGARERVAAGLRRAGAEVVEAPDDRLPAACVAAYLRAKARLRL